MTHKPPKKNKKLTIRCADSSNTWSSEKVNLIWTDPPFGTSKQQSQRGLSYKDTTIPAAINLVTSAIRLIPLSDNAVICVCADYRIIHDVVVELKKDFILLGEVIWTFGLGRPRTSWWPNRHNTIVTLSNGNNPLWDKTAIPTETRKWLKPGYTGPKTAGSVWDRTLSNTDPERIGYPNQKPISIIEPFILAHTKPGMLVADPFMGSGSTGEAALKNNRNFIGQDINKDACKLTKKRLKQI